MKRLLMILIIAGLLTGCATDAPTTAQTSTETTEGINTSVAIETPTATIATPIAVATPTLSPYRAREVYPISHIIFKGQTREQAINRLQAAEFDYTVKGNELYILGYLETGILTDSVAVYDDAGELIQFTSIYKPETMTGAELADELAAAFEENTQVEPYTSETEHGTIDYAWNNADATEALFIMTNDKGDAVTMWKIL